MSYNRNPNSADEVRPMSLVMIGKYGYGDGYGNGYGNGYGYGYGYGYSNGFIL